MVGQIGVRMDKLWKAVEREHSKRLGGQGRIPVHSTKGDGNDVKHDWLAVESKEKKSVPDWLTEAMQQAVQHSTEQKLPIVILHRKGTKFDEDLCFLRLKDFCDWFIGEADKNDIQ